MKNQFLKTAQIEAITASGGCTTGLPNRAYTCPDFFVWEREAVFANTWTCVGHGCNIPLSGDLKPVGFLGAPLLMLRNRQDQVKVFHNVCSHRGNELVWQPCHVDRLIRCPYHSWTYDLGGNLRATPNVGGPGKNEVEGFDRSGHGLREVRSEVWLDLVFVNLSGTAPPFEEFIAPLQRRVDRLGNMSQFAELRPARDHGSLTIDFSGNWKLDMENNLESYHLPWVHPDLNAVSRLEDHYHYYGGDLFAGQGSTRYDHSRINEKSFPLFDGWPEQEAEYPTLYPNVFLGLHCDHFWSRILEPVAVDRTLDHLQIYYLGDAAESDEYREEREIRLKFWTKVFNEDIGVIEGMQRGRRSPAFEGGVFTPLMDEPSHHFAGWIAEKLRSEPA